MDVDLLGQVGDEAGTLTITGQASSIDVSVRGLSMGRDAQEPDWHAQEHKRQDPNRPNGKKTTHGSHCSPSALCRATFRQKTLRFELN